MDAPIKTQVKIYLMEMDERTKQSLSLVFRNCANDALALTDVDTADIALIDLDRENPLKDYQAVRVRKPAIRAIGLSSRRDLAYDDVLVLQKPISVNRLLEAIQKVSGRGLQAIMVNTASAASSLSKRIGVSNTRNEASTLLAPDKMFFDPDNYLLGTMLNAVAEADKKDMAAVISFFGGRFILVDSKRKTIQTNLSSSEARAFALSAIGVDEQVDLSATLRIQRPAVEYLARSEAKNRFSDNTYDVPQETFMWKLGAMTSRGRLPAGMSPGERVYLRRWPNMTRFSYTDNVLRVIAYWSRQASSVREIAEALNIPEQEVCGVYVAAYAAGLAGKTQREVDGILEAPKVAEHRERGLISSILRRLIQRKPAVKKEEDAPA
jgi:hypothetical protein